MDEGAHIINVYAYYENFSNVPPRTSIEKTMLFVYVVPAEGEKELLRIYTDEDGKATFNFSKYYEIAYEQQMAYTFKFIYCPFCHPEDPGYPCGFEECVKSAAIELPPGISKPEDVPLAPGETPLSESELQRRSFLPTSITITYTPPPKPQTVTPAFCLPLLIIFALLGGALYYTGRNPFAAFSLGAPRAGRHIRYAPGSRGVYVSGKSIAATISSAISGGKEVKGAAKAGAAKGAAEAKVAKQGPKEIAKATKLEARREVRGKIGELAKGGSILVGGKIITGGKPGAGLERAKAAIKGGREVLRGAKMEFKAGMELIKREGAKGYGKLLGQSLMRAAGAILSSSFLSVFGVGKLAEKMMSFTTAGYRFASVMAEKQVAREEMQKSINKLEKALKAGEAVEIKIGGKVYYEVETKGGTLRIDKEALKNGEFVGTQIISRKDYVEERRFEGGYKNGEFREIQLTGITFKTGSGDKMTTATYAPVPSKETPAGVGYKLELSESKIGSGIKPGSEEYKNAHKFVHQFAGNIISAELIPREFANTTIGKGITIGSITNELAAGRYKLDVAIKKVDDAVKNMAAKAYLETDKKFNETVENIYKKVEKENKNFQKENKISDSGMAMMISNPPPADKTKENEIKEHYYQVANKQVREEGQMLLQAKIEKPTEAQKTAVNELLNLGTDIATLSKEDVLKKVEERLSARGFDENSRKEGLGAVEKTYQDAKRLSSELKSSADQASLHYSDYVKTIKNAAGEVIQSYYKDQPEYKARELQEQITNSVARVGTGGGMEGIATAILRTEAGEEFSVTPEQKFLREVAKKGLYEQPEQPILPQLEKLEGVRTKREPNESYEDWYKKLKVEERIIVDTEVEKYNKKLSEYQEKVTKFNELVDKMAFGDAQETGAVSATTLISSIEKGIKLSPDVYEEALSGIYENEPEKWKKAAQDAAPVIEKEMEKKEEKRLKGLAETSP